jgi:hypothetical protein
MIPKDQTNITTFYNLFSLVGLSSGILFFSINIKIISLKAVKNKSSIRGSKISSHWDAYYLFPKKLT